jgi:hypothetical protein
MSMPEVPGDLTFGTSGTSAILPMFQCANRRLYRVQAVASISGFNIENITYFNSELLPWNSFARKKIVFVH